MLRAATRFAARSRQEWRGLSTASLAALVLGLATCPARALDIYQWEWVDPTDLSKGIRQSSRLCPGGANVSLQPGTASYGKDLTMAYLPGADLKGATWSSAKLFMADLVGANLEGANLGGTNLSYAILGNANLARARFLEADLSNAYLTGADLTGADLECQLQNADFTNAKIAGATIGTYC